MQRILKYHLLLDKLVQETSPVCIILNYTLIYEAEGLNVNPQKYVFVPEDEIFQILPPLLHSKLLVCLESSYHPYTTREINEHMVGI